MNELCFLHQELACINAFERVFRWELCDEDDDDVELQTTEINVNFLAIIKDEER
jgi:hypothetical protein